MGRGLGPAAALRPGLFLLAPPSQSLYKRIVGEGLFFIVAASGALLSALALLFVRRPLVQTLCAILNVISVVAVYLLLGASILALLLFVVMGLLFASAVQLIRAVGPERLITRRYLTFPNVLGLLVSVLFGLLILLHLSGLTATLLPPLGADHPALFFNWNATTISTAGLAGLLLLGSLVSLYFLLSHDKARGAAK